MPGAIACISDIHANLEALRAVEEDLDELGSPPTICFGDVVGYGPDPVACCRWLVEREVPSIQGNHDEAVVLGESSRVLPEFNRFAKFSTAWTREQLGIEAFLDSDEEVPRDDALVSWLRSLPLIMAYDEWPELAGTLACHASLIEPEEFHYIEIIDPTTGQVDEKETLEHAEEVFEALESYYPGRRTLFTGHYHTPSFYWKGEHGPGRFVLPPEEMEGHSVACTLDGSGSLEVDRQPLEEENAREPGSSYVQFRLDAGSFDGPLILNPGSIGQPRDGIADASYMLYISNARRMIWRRVPYPVDETARKIREEDGLPDNLADRLERGR